MLHLTMDDSGLVMDTRADPPGRPVAIDRFLRTLAEAHGEHSVGLVLSGMGSNGTLGLADIKAEGGLAVAQSPSQAQHAGMPSSPVANVNVYFVLSSADIAGKLVALSDSAWLMRLPEADWLALPARGVLRWVARPCG